MNEELIEVDELFRVLEEIWKILRTAHDLWLALWRVPCRTTLSLRTIRAPPLETHYLSADTRQNFRGSLECLILFRIRLVFSKPSAFPSVS